MSRWPTSPAPGRTPDTGEDYRQTEARIQLSARVKIAKNLLTRGGMLPIAQVLEFEPNVDNAEGTQVWYNRIGLLMWFIVDGKCAPVTEKLVALQTALKSGKDQKTVAAAAKALEAELGKHDTDLRKFAGL